MKTVLEYAGKERFRAVVATEIVYATLPGNRVGKEKAAKGASRRRVRTRRPGK